jgi:glycosyltransferase involved in cell wall biosynthesis
MRNPGEAKVHENVRRVRAGVTYIPDYIWRCFFAFVGANFQLWRRRPSLYWQILRFALHRSIHERSTSALKRFLQAAYLVERDLPGSGAAHLHAHFSHDPTTVAFFASWLTGIPYSFSAHAKDMYTQNQDFLLRKIEKASFVVTCTEYNKGYLHQIAGMAAPIFRCYHGVDLDFFVAPVKANSNPYPRILSIGRFVPKKGFLVLIRALHLLREKGFNFGCTIIGSGPMENDLRKLILDLELGDCIELLSPMSQHELLQYYESADLFALASEVQDDGDRDGVPNVIVEAMAMEIPVVSTNVSGIPESVIHGENGILVPEKDPSALSEGIAAVLNQPEMARQFGRAGRKKVEQEFDSLRNVHRIGAAFFQAIGSGEWRKVRDVSTESARPGNAL